MSGSIYSPILQGGRVAPPRRAAARRHGRAADADRQGIYEPELLATSELLGKLARRVAPASVRRQLAEQQISDPHEDAEEARDEAA